MKKQFLLIILFLCICGFQNTFARKIHNRHCKFKITVPDKMVAINDTITREGDMYYDSTAGIIMIISVLEKTRFKSVNDYLNCSKEQLEQQLQKEYGDTTLTLISCRKPVFYPEKIVSINFRVAEISPGYNCYMIYFIHHHRKEIQISFTYKNKKEQSSEEYINEVMKTLKLKWP